MKKRILIASSMFAFLLGGLNLNAKENVRVLSEFSTHGTSTAKARELATKALIDLRLDEDTAIKIAEAVLVKVYGEKRILKQKPWIVEEKDYSFIIRGTLPPMTLGGVAEIEISKTDGAVISYKHGK